jgi:hypothetical protein
VEVAGLTRHGDARGWRVGSTQMNTGIQLMALRFFWLIATIDIVVSIGFALCVRTRITPKFNTDRTDALASSQRKDNWIACAGIWAVLLSDECPIRWFLFVTGAAVLTWLLQRTVQQFRTLQ